VYASDFKRDGPPWPEGILTVAGAGAQLLFPEPVFSVAIEESKARDFGPFGGRRRVRFTFKD